MPVVSLDRDSGAHELGCGRRKSSTTSDLDLRAPEDSLVNRCILESLEMHAYSG